MKSKVSQTKDRPDPEWNKERLHELAQSIPIDHGKQIDEEDVEFIQDCRALLRRQKSGLRGWLPWIAIALVVLLLWWASWAELDEVTRGIGKVIPSSSVQLIQSLEGGLLEKIYVKEGERVGVGQPLIRIQDAIFAANYEENLGRRDELIARLVRHQAESELKDELKFPEDTPKGLAANETNLFKKRKADYEATRQAMENQLTLAKQEEALLAAARESKAISPVELIRVQKEVADLEGKLRIHRTKFERDALERFDQDHAEFLALNHALKRDKDRLDRTMISSPVRGTVNKIHINTVGRVIGSGTDIMEIVPLGDTLLIEANIRPADVAFIRPGQQVIVKFTAYDFAIYGGLQGTVEQMSVDTITDDQGASFYRIMVRTTETTLGKDKRGEELAIMPGMVTEVDIITGKKTILAYLLKPITRARERALRER